MDKTSITDFLGSVSNIELTHNGYPLDPLHLSIEESLTDSMNRNAENLNIQDDNFAKKKLNEQYRFAPHESSTFTFAIGSFLFGLLAYSAIV